MSAGDVVKLADLPRQLEFKLTDQERREIEHELTHYPYGRAASIEALKIVQKHRGWVPDAAIPEIAKVIGIPAAELDGVATFYSLIFRQP
ncbi:MAG TPA: NAD(P)H-dependent oxidoreductase subunit E, partial [Nevskiaceae bacterium]|nr:NAD(P)H-dependent oxidoreductase subunit E [Nevskiaceae bacterium]